MTPSKKLLLTLLGVLTCQCAVGADIVVIGKLITNEPMSYVKDECPDGNICMHSWWKSVIQVEKTVQGARLAGRITAAVMQHTAMDSHYMKAVRFFILEPIEDPQQRVKLRADYYLKEASPPREMFCSSHDPKELGMSTEATYVSQIGGPTTYCFEVN
jgi:hypothetical protein